jgi:hypothetical protein
MMLLLQAGEFGVADLDAEVAARHQHGVGGVDDLGQVVDRFGAFDLGHQRRRPTRRRAAARAPGSCPRRSAQKDTAT